MNLTPLLKHRRVLITPLIVMAGLTLTGAVMQATASPVIPDTEPWPPFVMVYRVTENPVDENAVITGLPTTVLYRLEYIDRRHWQATVLESSNPANAVGSTWKFDGDKMISYNARFGTSRETPMGRITNRSWMSGLDRTGLGC